MGKRIIPGLELGNSWTSYIGSTYGVLRGAGLWQEEIYRLMGMTGMAFHFVMHKQSCPSSITVYDWMDEHLAMMDRIGVYSDVSFGHTGMNTFGIRQREAIARIKEAIDRGVGVVVWAPTPVLEFGIICGYDDEDRVFHVRHCLPGEPDPLLYDNLGKSEVSILFYQIVHERVSVPPERVHRSALRYGVEQWNQVAQHSADYACGRKGYDALIATLERGDYNPFGLCYNLQVYGDARDSLARYLRDVVAEVPALAIGEAAALYAEVAARYGRIRELAPFSGPQASAPIPGATPELLALAKECQGLEDRAIGIIARAL